MTVLYRPPLHLDLNRPEGTGWRGGPREPRVGVMLHYDASASDLGAIAWFQNPGSRNVGYHLLVLDDGSFVRLTPDDARAWHAGVCRTSPELAARGVTYRDANSAFIGISIAATDGDRATPVQLVGVAGLAAEVFDREGWDRSEVWRIVGHDTEAWPRGRKIDPTGSDPSRPVMAVEDVRRLVVSFLG